MAHNVLGLHKFVVLRLDEVLVLVVHVVVVDVGVVAALAIERVAP